MANAKKKKKKPPRITVVHRLSNHKHIPDFIIAVNAILAAMGKAASTFPDPDPTLVVAQGNNDKLATYTHQTEQGVPGALELRDAQKIIVEQDADHLRLYVSKIANVNPAQGAVVVAAAGMFERTSPGRGAQVFAILRQEESGSVVLTAPTNAGGRGTHIWQMALPGKDFVTVGQTQKAKILLKNLPVSTLLSFRHQPVVGDGPGIPSDVLTITLL